MGWDEDDLNCTNKDQFKAKGLFRCVSATKMNNLVDDKLAAEKAAAEKAAAEKAAAEKAAE